MPVNANVSPQPKYFHTLTFKHTFSFEKYQDEGPTVYFAYCIPFSYSKFLRELKDIKTDMLNYEVEDDEQQVSIIKL